jgi:hypothetical protein
MRHYLLMRVTLDRERDVAYIELEEPRRAYPDGGSNMLLPPSFPFRVDLVYDGDERLVVIAVEEASKRLHPDALKLAVPFEPVS